MDSKRRSRIQPKFVLEQLDERVVLSSIAPISFDHVAQVPAHLGQLKQPESVTPSAHGHGSTDAHRTGKPHIGNSPSAHKPANHSAIAKHAVTVHHAPSRPVHTQPILQPPATTAPQPPGTVPPATTAPQPTGTVPPATTAPQPQGTLGFGPGPLDPILQPPATTAPQPKSPPTVGPLTPYPDLDRLGQSLKQLFQAFEQGGASSANAVAQANHLQIQGDSVDVDVSTNGNFYQLISELSGLGMQGAAPINGRFVGYIPIAQLGNLSELTDTTSISPFIGLYVF